MQKNDSIRKLPGLVMKQLLYSMVVLIVQSVFCNVLQKRHTLELLST